jgi:regulatory protein
MPSDLKTLIEKGARYCAIQERCRSEIAKKLMDWGAEKSQIADVIAELEKQNFLDEKRFASAYTRGKFNQLGWGKIKIKIYLKQMGISPTIIGVAMQEIAANDYLETLQKLADKHLTSSKSTSDFERKANTYRFLLSRGFEPELAKVAVGLD